MEFSEIIKYLAEHLEVEIDASFHDCSSSQEIVVKLKIGDEVISESAATIFIDD